MTSCHFSRQAKDVGILYECGGRNLERPKGAPKWEEQQEHSRVDAREGTTDLYAYDDDTPCEITLYWPDPNGLETAKKLMKDLLAAATPAVVGKPRLEAVYMDPQSAPGRAFLASPEAWKKETAGVDGFMTLPAGYPKLVDGKSIAGLPDGKVALVGLCPIGHGGSAVQMSRFALPGLQRVLVEAPGLAAACPYLVESRDVWQFEGEPELKIGDRTLGLELYHTVGDFNPKSWARAFLRAADGSLLSVAADQLDMDKTVYETDCKVTLKTAKAGATFKVHCKVGTPDFCKHDPWWSFTQTIRVVGDKVTIQHAVKSSRGEGCEGTYE
jgi:hypothetical protein